MTRSVEALLTAENLTKHYNDVVALDDVSFGISDGIIQEWQPPKIFFQL